MGAPSLRLLYAIGRIVYRVGVAVLNWIEKRKDRGQ